MVEIFEKDQIYTERFREILPEYLLKPIDYYIAHNVKPQVVRYNVAMESIHNGVPLIRTPVFFEAGDNFEVKVQFQRVGHIGFNEYMKFIHEAYKVDKMNINNEYQGTWSFKI